MLENMGTMGLEPMISSARGWQYTKLTYVPKMGQNLIQYYFWYLSVRLVLDFKAAVWALVSFGSKPFRVEEVHASVYGSLPSTNVEHCVFRGDLFADQLLQGRRVAVFGSQERLNSSNLAAP